MHDLCALQRRLIDRHERGLRNLRIVKGRNGMVQMQHRRLFARLVKELNIGVLFEHRILFIGHHFNHVDFAFFNGIGDRLRIAQDHPVELIDVDVLAAGRAVSGLIARHIVRVLKVDHLFARTIAVCRKHVGA